MKKEIMIIIIAAVVVVLAVGAFFVFHKGSNSVNSNSQQYQVPATVSGNATQTVSQFSGLNLTPAPSQTDTVPSTSTNIPAP